MGRIAQRTYEDGTFATLRRDRLEVSIGVIGPAALAGEVQRGWHHLWKAQRPAGWNNQLRNEPAILVRYDATLQFPDKLEWFAVEPQIRAFLGNVSVSAETGIAVRLGYCLKGFGTNSIPFRALEANPSGRPLQTSCADRRSGKRFISSAEVFGRAVGRAVLHNIFLDGNTFRTGPSVDKRTFVSDLALGVQLIFFDRVSLSGQIVRRSPEFDSPLRLSRQSQKFGAITVAVHQRIN